MGEPEKKKVEEKKVEVKKVEEKKVEVKKDEKKDEKKVEIVKTAVYKVYIHCGKCAKDIETEFTEFQGVEEVKVDRKAGKVTVKGFGFDEKKLGAKVQKGCRKKVEFVPPAPKKDDVVTEVKSKEQELKVITVKVPLHCRDCALKVKEILLENKSIYEAKTDHVKNTCTVEGVLDEKKLVEYIYKRTRKGATVDKVDKKVIVKKETVEVKKEEKKEVKKDEKKEEKKEVKKEEKKEVIAPYFIPCTHPRFLDYSHPWHHHGGCYGGDWCSPCGGDYGYGGGYPYGFSYKHEELKGYRDTAFLHCTHPNEFLSEENPYACSVM
ncbi:hypothetical protein HU200_063274 [Digitaria exilis]|uniref:HMA domain-containing protein n=1 Tax=Digitaria exilis TaxID=1010633 RepID=A0A835ABT5_9POAL|nr:hypothetical protein HU200_063274 [Digitaria exilis]CAB3485585.1 unnamed protein product [Digitaria exilis]